MGDKERRYKIIRQGDETRQIEERKGEKDMKARGDKERIYWKRREDDETRKGEKNMEERGDKERRYKMMR